jgi:hypothetical protein
VFPREVSKRGWAAWFGRVVWSKHRDSGTPTLVLEASDERRRRRPSRHLFDGAFVASRPKPKQQSKAACAQPARATHSLRPLVSRHYRKKQRPGGSPSRPRAFDEERDLLPLFPLLPSAQAPALCLARARHRLPWPGRKASARPLVSPEPSIGRKEAHREREREEKPHARRRHRRPRRRAQGAGGGGGGGGGARQCPTSLDSRFAMEQEIDRIAKSADAAVLYKVRSVL